MTSDSGFASFLISYMFVHLCRSQAAAGLLSRRAEEHGQLRL
jgi:hypothetical protein